MIQIVDDKCPVCVYPCDIVDALTHVLEKHHRLACQFDALTHVLEKHHPMVEQALQNVDGVADVSRNESVAVPIVDGVAKMAPSAVASEIRAPPDDLGLIRQWLFQLYSSQNFEAADAAVVAELRQLAERLFNDLPISDFQIVDDKCPVCVDQSACDIVDALTHVLEKHHDILPADDDVPFADTGRDIGDGQRFTFDVAYWEWLKNVLVSIDPDTDHLVWIEGGELVSPEVARQVWLERAGACIVAALACLMKWKEALDQGCPSRELGEEERRQQQQDCSLL